MIKAIKFCRNILKDTPEEWLNFSAGQNSKFNLNRYKNISEYYSGIFRLFIFVRWFILRLRITINPLNKKSDLLLYAGSINQLTVLDPVYSHLIKNDLNIRAISDIAMSDCKDIVKNNWGKAFFDFRVILVTIYLLTANIFSLLIRLNDIDKRLLKLRLNGFLSVYAWLPFFYYSLRINAPKIILLSNDHNPDNRVLIEIAKSLNILTAYIQHGGVSERFHSLDFNYSFLDGKYSLDVYLSCENRRSARSKLPAFRKVILSGILRRLNKKINIKKNCEVVGMTIKGTDALSQIINLRNRINKKIIFRPHPNLNFNAFKSNIEKSYVSESITEFSNPLLQPVDDFLNSIDVLISGNSTILLEAALIGVYPIYWHQSKDEVFDYYQYVKNNICYMCDSEDKIIELLSNHKYRIFKSNIESLRYYSASYGTQYEYKESMFVAKNLISIIKGENLDKNLIIDL